MREGDLSADRRGVQEDEYLGRKHQELIERLKRRAEVEAERRLIGQAIGVDDVEVVLDLQRAGYTAETIVLLELALPVQVAWADGRVSTRERELLLKIAAREHVAQNSRARIHLDMWLDRRPSAHLFEASLLAVRAVLSSLEREVRPSLRRKLIDDCGMIATAAGGLVGWGPPVSNQELQTIERIVAELSQR